MVGNIRYIVYFVIALTALAIGVSAVSRLFIKADLPFDYGSSRHESFVESDFGELKSGDLINAVNDIPVESAFEIETLIDNKLPGDVIRVTFTDQSSARRTLPVTLVKFYNDYLFIIVTTIAGYAFWILGVFVVASKPKDKAAILLFLTLVSFAVAILSTSGYYGRNSDWIGYVIRISHPFSYLLGSILFLMFILNFPYETLRSRNILTYSLYSLTGVLCIYVSIACYLTLRDLDTTWHDVYQNLWKLCEIILFTCLILGTIILIFKYRRITDRVGRSKIEWIFWGMTFGVAPFIIFWLVPNIFKFQYFIREELILAFLLIVPVSFAVAVVKYHALDIEVIIKRSIIYFTLIGLMIFIYSELIFISSNILTKYLGYESKIFYIVAAILIALLLNPLRMKIKSFVDRFFFREKYAFDKAIQKISLMTKECHSYDELGDMLLSEINTLIPVKSIAILAKTISGDRLRVIAQNNFETVQKNIGAFRVKNLLSRVDLPFSYEQKVEPDLPYNNKMEAILKRWQIAMVIPLSFDSSEAVGAIILGDKLSGMRYSKSDFQLLNTIASSAALVVKRLELQEKLIMEEVELEKAKEISELKSYFVASVSHDLKTPLSAIKIFSELLQNENITKEKSGEYLTIIEGETDRLKRMIDNILDFSKMEKRQKQFSFRKLDLNKAASEVMQRMSYELRMQKFTVDKNIATEPLYINADPDAVNSVLENIISNSIKYSEKRKYLKISTARNNGNAEVTIEDGGKGIPGNNLEHIFDAFYRERSVESSNIKGAGLGLAIVKNIVDAHEGVIDVQSKEGHGSTFHVTFPIYENGNEDTVN